MQLSVTHWQMPSAYLLISHGSRDPRPQIAMEQLAQMLSQSLAPVETAGDLSWSNLPNSRLAKSSRSQLAALSIPKILVGTACLELSSVPLHEQIKEFGDRALATGYNCIQLIPLFLLPGIHVMEDIPEQVAIAQQRLGQKLKIALQPYLGTHSGLIHLLAAKLNATTTQASVLLAHGSRRPGCSQLIAAMAKQLGAIPAYWAMPPRLESQVKQLISAGYQQIGIVPYFLFAGGITDAIAQSVEQLQHEFPTVNLLLTEPLGATQELANLILDLVEP